VRGEYLERLVRIRTSSIASFPSEDQQRGDFIQHEFIDCQEIVSQQVSHERGQAIPDIQATFGGAPLTALSWWCAPERTELVVRP
jgi:hypothetical protein